MGKNGRKLFDMPKPTVGCSAKWKKKKTTDVPTICTFLISENIKFPSPICFGSCVPSSVGPK